jgi:hypothetical protein
LTQFHELLTAHALRGAVRRLGLHAAWEALCAWAELGSGAPWNEVRERLAAGPWPSELGRHQARARAIVRAFERRSAGGVDWGTLHEQAMDDRPLQRARFGRGTRSGRAARRRRLGSFYTPPARVEELLDLALEPVLDRVLGKGPGRGGSAAVKAVQRLRIVDPACGSGRFLVGALARLARRIAAHGAQPEARVLQQVCRSCLFGVDVDRTAARVARIELARAAGMPSAAWLDENVRHGDALLAWPWERSSFDVVLGNPPFVDSERMSRQAAPYRASVRERYACARGNWDLFVPFFELALEALHPGGTLGFVAPAKLLAAEYCGPLQARLALERPRLFRHLGEAPGFGGARVPLVLAVVDRAGPGGRNAKPSPVRFEVAAGGERSVRFLAHELLTQLPRGYWTLGWQNGAEHWLALARAWPALGTLAEVEDGCTTSEAYALRDLLGEPGPGAEPEEPALRVVNTGTIDPGRLRWGEVPMRYLGRRLLRPQVKESDLARIAPARLARARADKIAVAGLGLRLEAAHAPAGVWCAKSTVVVVPQASVALASLLRWLNSSLATRLFRALLAPQGLGAKVVQVGARQLARLPCPPLQGCPRPPACDLPEDCDVLETALRSGLVSTRQG